MKVVGLAQVFQCREESFPIPKDDEVVIQVLATCVNKLDLWCTHMDNALHLDSDVVLGLECVGTIIEVGKDVHEWKVSEQVCAVLNGGSFAEAVIVRATHVLPLPLDRSFVYPLPLDKSFIYQVAGLPHAACVTWEAISRIGKLSANMTLLVYERCGKICDLAVQLAEIVEASVIVARDESTFIKNFSHPIVDVKSEDFVKDVLEATGDKKGVDIILDCDVSIIQLWSIPLRATGGTIVLVDLGPDEVSTVDILHLYRANAVLHVVDIMWWTPKYIGEVVMDMKKNMWPAFNNGSLVLPEMGEQKSYQLSDAALAQSGDILTPFSNGSLNSHKGN